MQTKRLAAAALSLTLLLSACGGNPAPAGGSAQPSTPAQESPSAPPSSGIDTGVKMYRDYVDRHCGFKLKTPVLQTEDKVGVGYFIERGGGDDDNAIIFINHYNEKQDGDAYDTTQFDTAEHALAELQQDKMEVLAAIIDEMAYTYEDGPAE